MRAILFVHNQPGVLIIPQPGKTRVPQVTVWRPLIEFDLRHELRPKPSAVFHIRFCQSYVPPIAARFRQICEWATGGFKILKKSVQRALAED